LPGIEHDLAALRITGVSLPSVHLGTSAAIKTGDHVTVLGAPLGLESTLSDGIVSAVREAGSLRIFQTSAPISHGSSGGPLFDDYGSVVAIAVATIESGENLNFAVPIDSAKTLLSNITVNDVPLKYEYAAESQAHRQRTGVAAQVQSQVHPADASAPRWGVARSR
jgi:serine protease Do